MEKALFASILAIISLIALADPPVVNGNAGSTGSSPATSTTAGIVKPDNQTITIANGVITAVGGSATGVTVGTTTVGSGTSGSVEYNNAGVLGEKAVGTGTNQIVQGGVITAAGPAGGASTVPIITYNAAGQLTAVSTAAVVASVSTLSGAGTGVDAALAVNVGTAGAPVINGGVGGTPSSMTGTNITGTAAGFTAGNVTTNANLTGVITSIGNATSTGAQTGTGSTFVMQTSPSIASPTVTGAFSATGLVTLADHATQATNTIIGNATSGTASPTALAIGSCSGASNALTWTTNTGFGCNTISGGGSSSWSSLTAPTVSNSVTATVDTTQTLLGHFDTSAATRQSLFALGEDIASTKANGASAASMFQISTLAGSTAQAFNVGLEGIPNVFRLQAGTSGNSGGLTYTGLPDSTTTSGGSPVSFVAGAGGATNVGGFATLSAGTGGGGGGGNANIMGGADSGAGAGGNINLTPGTSATGTKGEIFHIGPTVLGNVFLNVAMGALGFDKVTADGVAPGAAGAKLQLVCGTNSGTAKLIISAGTSATTITIVDNVGAGVTGC